MKKVILSLAIVVAGLGATSCQKSYNCTCYDSATGSYTHTTTKASTLAGAETKCFESGADCY